jgi:signal transduction histidine kinase
MAGFTAPRAARVLAGNPARMSPPQQPSAGTAEFLPREAEAPSPAGRTAYLVVAAAIAGVFALDLATPLGIAVPFLYLLAIRLAIALRASNLGLLTLATVCTALAAIKLFVPGTGGVLLFGQSNRLLFALLLWALIGFEYVRRTTALRRDNERLKREIAERIRAEQTINGYAERLRGLADRLVETQESERKALAEDLHDRIGQNLSTLNISLNLALANLPSEAAALVRPRIDDVMALVERTTEMVRGAMEELHPALLDQYGLDTALRWYAEALAQRVGIVVAYEATELFPRLRGKTETALFRIAQEALTNVAKHAGAQRVDLALRRNAAGIELEVRDDGAGMPAATAAGIVAPAAGSGWGVTMMRERARAIGATLQIETAAGKGTTIRVAVPKGVWETREAKDDDKGSDRR